MDIKENTEKSADESLDTIKEVGGVATDGRDCSIFCLSIIGQIEGHYSLDNTQKTTKYDHLLPLLAELEESPKIDGILILLNTLGGDVEAGLAISEMIASITKPTASIVLGGGHSIGVPLAVSAKKSFIVPSATMTIHPVRTSGLVLGVPQSFDYLLKMQERIIRFITTHSSVKEEDFRRMMTRTDTLVNDIGYILDGEEACRCGLIDSLGGLGDALGYLHEECKRAKEK